MLYYKNLNSLIFENYPRLADEVKILSGYVGPVPMNRLKELPIKSTVIFGLFKENRKKKLHDEILKIHSEHTGIFYPEILSHSKIYVWLKDGIPIKGLVGSANFSANGLNSDYRETLFEVDERQAMFLNSYIDIILNSARPSTAFTVEDTAFQESASTKRLREQQKTYVEGVVNLRLLNNQGELPIASGLNWGMAENGNVRSNDAYIAIRKDDIRLHPELFSPRHELPIGISARANLDEVIEIIWDDGEIMQARFEGTQDMPDIGGLKYPKQLASYPNKDILGLYMRRRLNVQPSTLITKSDLEAYGANQISLSKIEDGIYSAEFKKTSLYTPVR